jgi:hypothetical protein
MLAKVILKGSVSKASDWDCQDAWAEGPSRAAVADGVTNSSYMSRHFAQRLVDCFVDPGVSLAAPTSVQAPDSPSFAPVSLGPGALSEFADHVRRWWRKDVDEVYLPVASEHQRSGWTAGDLASHATFAGIGWQCRPDGHCTLACFVVGDCFIFIGREDEEVRTITGAEPGDTSLTQAISVGSTNDTPFFSQLHAVTIAIDTPDTWVMLTTDFIGKQLHRDLQGGSAQWPHRFKSLVQLRNQSDLLRWVRQHVVTEAGGGTDDAAVILLKFKQEAAAQDSGLGDLVAALRDGSEDPTPESERSPVQLELEPLDPDQNEPQMAQPENHHPGQSPATAAQAPALACPGGKTVALKHHYRLILVVTALISLLTLAGLLLVRRVVSPANSHTSERGTRTAALKKITSPPSGGMVDAATTPQSPEGRLTPQEASARVNACIRAMANNATTMGITITPGQNQRALAPDLRGLLAQMLWADLYIAYKKPDHVVNLGFSDLDAVRSDPLYQTLEAVAGKKADYVTLNRLALTPCPAAER